VSGSNTVMLLALLAMGCASPSGALPPPTQLQASLRQPCLPLPELTDGSAGAVLVWIKDAAKLYGVCASRHLETVAAWPR
jgi:hypothetical protein